MFRPTVYYNNMYNIVFKTNVGLNFLIFLIFNYFVFDSVNLQSFNSKVGINNLKKIN